MKARSQRMLRNRCARPPSASRAWEIKKQQRRVGAAARSNSVKGELLLVAFAFGFPIARLRVALTAVDFNFAFDRVVAHFAVVLGSELISIEFANHFERNLV